MADRALTEKARSTGRLTPEHLLPGSGGAVSRGSAGPNRVTVGTPTAAATCAGPLSAVTSTSSSETKGKAGRSRPTRVGRSPIAAATASANPRASGLPSNTVRILALEAGGQGGEALDGPELRGAQCRAQLEADLRITCGQVDFPQQSPRLDPAGDIDHQRGDGRRRPVDTKRPQQAEYVTWWTRAGSGRSAWVSSTLRPSP